MFLFSFLKSFRTILISKIKEYQFYKFRNPDASSIFANDLCRLNKCIKLLKF